MLWGFSLRRVHTNSLNKQRGRNVAGIQWFY